MFEIISHFLNFLWLIAKDITNAALLIIGLIIFAALPFLSGIAVGFWLGYQIWAPLAPFIAAPLAFVFLGISMMILAYLDTVWNKARPKKRKV